MDDKELSTLVESLICLARARNRNPMRILPEFLLVFKFDDEIEAEVSTRVQTELYKIQDQHPWYIEPL